MADLKEWDNKQLIAHNACLNSQEWKRNIALRKQKDRHKGIDFNNELFNKHKAKVKQEMESRGLK